MAEKPQLYSVWLDSKGEKWIITALDDEDGEAWFVVLVPYDDRFANDGPAQDLDAEEWAELLAKDGGFTQIGIEPGEYPM